MDETALIAVGMSRSGPRLLWPPWVVVVVVLTTYIDIDLGLLMEEMLEHLLGDNGHLALIDYDALESRGHRRKKGGRGRSGYHKLDDGRRG